MSSATPISLQDNTQESDTSDLGDFDEMAEFYTNDRDRYISRLCYPIRIGDVLIDTYRIEHRLGHGNFSSVWLAHDIKTERDVALKITAPGSGVGEYE